MGRPGSNNSQSEATIQHFSHSHPLHLSNYQPPQPNHSQLNQPPATCSGCKHKLTSGGLIYTCTTCTHFLHINCSKLPKEITHPFHKNHVFSLLSKPAYPTGTFNCDACKQQGDGFSYHCKECSNFDLHIHCASLPLSRIHHSHSHELKLTFASPYASKDFNCDVCKNLGSDHWLYRCHLCEYDVHLDCVKNVAPAPVPAQIPQNIGIAARSIPQPQGSQPFVPQYMAPVPNFTPMMNPHMPVGLPQTYDMVYQQTLQSILANAAQSQSRFGQQDIYNAILNNGGNAIGNAGMSSLMQGLTGGGSSGGGLDMLQGLLGSGGGGGGGGGGLGMLQGLLGGGGGIPGLDGLGGLDGLLGGLGGFL